jgi:signal transduction histidine kinase
VLFRSVDVEAAADLHCNDRLAAEVFQMVAEGLSNIRRHTQATQAKIGLLRRNGYLVLRVENEGAPVTSPELFTPRSITERAAALGGQVLVERTDEGTAVVVEIPL